MPILDSPRIFGVEIEGELGRGAHSVVYRGQQGGAPCAIKLPRTKARWTRWIYREAVALARVKHPSLPAVLEVGEVNGLPFLVMELVEGQTLADRIVEGLSESAAIDVARQLSSVLTAVHDAGLVHRDVKPRNIVLERSTSLLKLVDFGFATPMERVGTGDTAGTAAYSAPEQLSPPGIIDGRADLYAVGRVLFECLTGELLVKTLDGPYGEGARARLVAEGVSPGVAEIVAGLLRRKPEERYPDARALSADLDRVTSGLLPLGPKRYVHHQTAAHLVARDVELERVVGACRNLRDGGMVVLVRAPRGGGKSRLLQSAANVASEFGRTVAVTCRQDDPPLATLRRLLETYCGESPERPNLAGEDFRASLGNLAPVARLIAPSAMTYYLPPISGIAGGLMGPTSPEPPAAPDSLTEGAAEILIRLATRFGPTVIMIDDGQWMDPVSVDALVRLAHRLPEAPIALVLASRPDSGGFGERISQARPERTTVFDLPRLTEHDVRALIASHLGEVTVDDELVRRVCDVAGGTPLGVLEVLGAFLDAGALRPHARAWVFENHRTDHVKLPQGAITLLGRRLAELPAATTRVLEMAAIMGASFDDARLASALEVTTEDLGFAMAAARRAGLLEVELEGHGHRFVHDSIREMLIDDLSQGECRRLHQRVAEMLDVEEAHPSFEDLCAKASHFAAGEMEKNPARVYSVVRAASEAAVARFDNETALKYQTQARVAAEAAQIPLDTAFFVSVGEAYLRLGALDQSREAFETALTRAPDAITKASVLGRISWVHQTRAEPDQAWATLDRAFSTLGVRMPIEDSASAVATSAGLALSLIERARKVRSRGANRGTEETRKTGRTDKTDLLCELHYVNARLGLEYGKPARLIQSSLESVRLSERGASTNMRARAHAFYAFVMIALGRHDAGAREIALAKEIASRAGDAAAMAFCVQNHAVAATFAGDLDQALLLFRECASIHGPWLELNEYCGDVSSAHTIQSLRGRAVDAWPWIERALERVRRSRVRPELADFLIHRARAALAAVGRDVKDDPWLTAQLALVSPKDPGRGFHRLASWGPRARYYLEMGELGPDFEDVVRDFRNEGHKPRSVHIVVSEYYVTVAHARIHQTLREASAARSSHLPALRAAVSDLRGAAKVALLRAHALLAEGSLSWFEGNERKGKKLLTDAEALANQQSCPWVLYGVARMRAHILRAEGKEEAAHDQARAAELFARDHGAVTRARWVREEFALTAHQATDHTVHVGRSSSHGSSSARANRQLTALLQVARAPRRDLKTEQQAAAILDELINSLDAERAAIVFQPEQGTAPTSVIRARNSETSVSLSPESARGALLHRVHRTGIAWPPLIPTSEVSSLGSIKSSHNDVDEQVLTQFDAARVLAVPLFVYDKPVGALCIERSAHSPPLELDDRNLLILLSHQVPIALEIARLLFEREQLHASLQHAKKMEAMGVLAGGLAHDFNNMLAAMRFALHSARERAALDVELTAELDIVSDATQRAAQLTSQLLSFSRHQPVPVAVHDVNQLIGTLEPMLRRIVGDPVKVVTKLSHAVDAVEVDQGSFDQALVNLFINARDAMPGGGTLSISTKNVVMADTAAQRVNLPAGDYVEIAVTDTGEGMNAETLSRIFEPFFTTKQAGKGSGLGLAMVYAFARNCGGSIDVSSDIGQGTQFRIYLKRVDRSRLARAVRPPALASAAAPSSSVSLSASVATTTTTSPSASAASASSSTSSASSSSTSSPSSPPMTMDAPDTILVVDDDDLVRRSIAKILERNGYRVVAASGSVEALNVAREQGARIALVILDVLMPGLTGPELGRRLFDLNLSAKMLFVSGFSPESIPFANAQVAAELLLQKPFTQTTLLERVRQLMHRDPPS